MTAASRDTGLRLLLGGYLLVHFVALLPWGPEVFSRAGVLQRASDSPLAALFPSVLACWDSPAAVTLLLAAAASAALWFAAGWWSRAAAVSLGYALACLSVRNPLVANPALPFLGWLLLAHALTPRRSPGHDLGPDWAAGWVVMALAYSYSGYTKLGSPSWLDGSALARVVANPLARPGPARDLLLALPPAWLQVATWGALGLELAFAPLALSRRARPVIWALMAGLHLALLVLVRFADLTAGMLLVHAATFDPAWLRARPPAGRAQPSSLASYG